MKKVALILVVFAIFIYLGTTLASAGIAVVARDTSSSSSSSSSSSPSPSSSPSSSSSSSSDSSTVDLSDKSSDVCYSPSLENE